MKRYLLVIGLALAVIGATVWFGLSAVEQDRNHKPRTAPKKLPVKTITLFGTRISGRREGRPFWHFDAERVEQALSGGPTTFFNLRNGCIFRDGKPYISFSADSARHDPKNEEIRLTGNLVAVFPEGTLFTEEAIWYIRTERLVVSVPVRIDAKQYSISAGSMEVDLSAETAKLLGGVVMTKGDKTTAYSETLTHSLKDGMFEVPGPFSLEVEIDDESETGESE